MNLEKWEEKGRRLCVKCVFWNNAPVSFIIVMVVLLTVVTVTQLQSTLVLHMLAVSARTHTRTHARMQGC